MARSRKKKSSESVRAAGLPGPADLADTTFCTPIWQRDSFCVSFYYSRFPVSQENHRFCQQVSAIAVAFHFPPEVLITSHFLHPRSSWRRYLIFVQRVFLLSAHSSRRFGSIKVWLHFISGYPLKKRSWLSACDLKRSGTQK